MIQEVLDVMRGLAEDGMTMVVVTTRWASPEAAPRILFMDGGVVVEGRPPAEFFAHPRHERTRRSGEDPGALAHTLRDETRETALVSAWSLRRVHSDDLMEQAARLGRRVGPARLAPADERAGTGGSPGAVPTYPAGSQMAKIVQRGKLIAGVK